MDLPATLLKQVVDSSKVAIVPEVPPAPYVYPDYRRIQMAADLIVRAKKPLVIVGKGIAEARINLIFAYHCMNLKPNLFKLIRSSLCSC